MMSDASDMLAAALEQMDGIIAGTNVFIMTIAGFSLIQQCFFCTSDTFCPIHVSFPSLPKHVLFT